MLDYVVKLSLEPWDIEEVDVQELREGVSVMPVFWENFSCYWLLAYVNRLADGLGGGIGNILERKSK
ncbi:MAG: hypothetical protein Ct9H300mP28_18220 [Pseudomonadota bacterium]|nr:MAG: hypothetical protein Ct9H300mP28_18220 [Pseudomonadota bacterium]